MRVLIFSTNGVINDGITSWLIQYVSLIDRTGLEIDTIAFEGADDALINRLAKADVRTHVLPSRRRKVTAYIREFRRLLRIGNYDIVHINGSSATVALELLCCVGTGAKARIVHSRNTRGEHQFLDAIARPVMKMLLTDRVACGKDAGRWLFGSENFTVIPNGKDFHAYRFSEEARTRVREHLGLTDDQFAVGHVGNFNDQKNHRFLIRAFAEALRANSRLRLVLIGDGCLRVAVETEVRELGIEDHVVFTGRTHAVPEYLSAFDLAVLPSLYEGFPNVVIEWQASGLPSLVSATVTNECAVTDLVTLLPIDEPLVWARAMAETMPVDRPAAASASQKLLRASGFEAQDGAVRLRDLYDTIAAREGIQ